MDTFVNWVKTETAHSAEFAKILGSIPKQPGRQDSCLDQLFDLLSAAKRLGLQDAATWLQDKLEQIQKNENI